MAKCRVLAFLRQQYTVFNFLTILKLQQVQTKDTVRSFIIVSDRLKLLY